VASERQRWRVISVVNSLGVQFGRCYDLERWATLENTTYVDGVNGYINDVSSREQDQDEKKIYDDVSHDAAIPGSLRNPSIHPPEMICNLKLSPTVPGSIKIVNIRVNINLNQGETYQVLPRLVHKTFHDWNHQQTQ